MKKTTITTSGNFHKKEYEKLNKTEQYVDSGEKIHTTSKHDIKSQVVGGSGTVNTASFAHNVERMTEKKQQSNVYNPEKRYEEKQRREQGYENRVRNNQSVHVGQGLKTDISNVNSEKTQENHNAYKQSSENQTKENGDKKETKEKGTYDYVKNKEKRNKAPLVLDKKNNIHLTDMSRKYIQNQLQKTNDLGLNAIGLGITGAYALSQYYKISNKGFGITKKAISQTIKSGYHIGTGVYKHTASTIKRVQRYGVKKTIYHQIQRNHIIHTAKLLTSKNIRHRNKGIQVIKQDGKFLVKGFGATTVKMGKATLKTSVKSGNYIVKTAIGQGIGIFDDALNESDDIGVQTLATAHKSVQTIKATAKASKEITKFGIKATGFSYRGIKTGVKLGVKTDKKTVSAAKYIQKNGWKRAGQKVKSNVKTGVKNIFSNLLSGLKNLLLAGMKELLIGGAGIGIIGLVVILTTPLLLFGAFFSGEAKDENDITWSIHDYVSAMSQKQVKSYADDVIGLYNKLKDDNEIITLYNNLSGEEIAIEKDTILSSIPNADDFTNIIEPVFNVLMITRYSMTVEESQKKETYVYLWNLLNNLYSEKLSMEYCDSPDEDGVYYAKETCLRSSDTKYHKKYSGRNCCEESYSCKGHTSYCTDLSKCTNKTIAGKCGGHTTYCTDADLKSCTNKEYHFKCNGYKECLGHRRTRIVMDFNGINALIAEEWDDRINELQLKDTLTDKETEELKLLISNRNFCLAYVDFLKLQDDSYSTDYSVTGNVTGGNGNDTVDLGQYDFDESIGAKIAEAGLQKIGYNYAFGGLTWCNDTTKKGSVGIDCSGFTYILTKEITGKTIPRTAAAQSQGGISINSLADAKAGDFIFYGRNGVTGVGHVGIYLGNGKIVHASNPNDGVKISNATYKQILAIRRYW